MNIYLNRKEGKIMREFIFSDYIDVSRLRPSGCLIENRDEELMENIDAFFGGYPTKECRLCDACKALAYDKYKSCEAKNWLKITA